MLYMESSAPSSSPRSCKCLNSLQTPIPQIPCSHQFCFLKLIKLDSIVQPTIIVDHITTMPSLVEVPPDVQVSPTTGDDAGSRIQRSDAGKATNRQSTVHQNPPVNKNNNASRHNVHLRPLQIGRSGSLPQERGRLRITMGINSRYANGSIRKMKKRGQRRNKFGIGRTGGHHFFVTDQCDFKPETDCPLCKRYAQSKEGANKYKHGHHRDCPNKPCNRKKLQIERRHINPWRPLPTKATNTSTGAPDNNPIGQSSIQYTRATYRRMGSVGHSPAPVANSILPFFQTASNDSDDDSSIMPTDFITDMRTNMDMRVSQAAQPGSEYTFVLESSAPAAVVSAWDHLLSQFTGHRRPARADGSLPHTPGFQQCVERYYETFHMNSCDFTFPNDHAMDPSPNYHQLEGQTFIYLDWQLCFKNMRLPCPTCAENVGNGLHEPKQNSWLVHDRTNFSKNKGSLFPILKIKIFRRK